MPQFEFNIHSWGVWVEGDSLPKSQGRFPLRRRLTPMGRTSLELAHELPNPAKARYVYSSRHGEFERTLSLMGSILRQDEPSPADFSLSVHHALIGLLSIEQQNQRGHTAIAAGADSFCFGLMEAAACLADNPDEPILFIHCDSLLPAPYDVFTTGDEIPVVLALALTGSPQAGDTRITQQWSDTLSSQAGHHAVTFLNFLRSDASSCVSQGHDRRWQWNKHALA